MADSANLPDQASRDDESEREDPSPRPSELDNKEISGREVSPPYTREEDDILDAFVMQQVRLGKLWKQPQIYEELAQAVRRRGIPEKCCY